MIEKKRAVVHSLSTVIGTTLTIFLLVFSLIGLVWTYSTTNHLLAKQVLDTFDKRLAIASSILKHQEQLLLFSLSTIKNDPNIVDGISLWKTGNTEDMLVLIFDNSTEFPLDILFVASTENEVLADISSPFYSVNSVLDLMIKERITLLNDAKVLHLDDGENNLTFLARGMVITDEQTGEVVGTLFGGTVLNDNTSLLLKIRRETSTAAVTLLSDGKYLASTEKKNSSINTIALTPESRTTSFFSQLLNDDVYTVDDIIMSPRLRLYEDKDAVVEVVFAMPDIILSELRSSYVTKSVFLVGGALIFILLSVLVVRGLTFSSLKHLLHYSDEIGAGSMSASYKPGKIKEFNQLGYAMENMVIGLREVNQQLNSDVIARTEAEKALRASELHLRTLLESIPDLIWLKDKDGVFLSCNRQFELFMGLSHEEILGKTDYDFFDRESADSFKEFDEATIAAEEPCMVNELVIRGADGQDTILETIKTAMYSDDNTLIGVLGIARDITERKRLESQILHGQKVEAIGTMAGGIAHDFNNILAAILGYAEIARHKLTDDEHTKKPIEQVIQASLRAKELVQHILSFSRKDEIKENFHHVNLANIVEEVLSFQQSVIPKTIEVETDFQIQEAVVLGEKTQLHQVLMNLCTNAWQAMEQDGVLSKSF